MTEGARALPTEADWEQAAALLAEASEVALACHVAPDGDALGSMLALAVALRDLGKTVFASHGTDPFLIPDSLSFMTGQELLVPPADFPAEPEVMLTFDTGNVERLGSLQANAEKATHLVVVDHHVTNTRFGTVNLVDSEAASTTVLVDRLIQMLGVPLTAEIAVGIYTGLITDTGSFKYPSTTPDVHQLAARLLATGIRHDLISRSVWDTTRFAYIHLLGEVLSRAVLEPERRLIWSYCTVDDLRTHGIALHEIEGVIDVLRRPEEAEVAVILKGDVDGTIKVSTRSKGGIDVGRVCESLGGGGHHFAAGYTSTESVEATMERLRAALAEAPRLSA